MFSFKNNNKEITNNHKKFEAIPEIDFEEIKKHGKEDAALAYPLSNDNLPVIILQIRASLHKFYNNQYSLAQKYFLESQTKAGLGLDHTNTKKIKTELSSLTTNSDDLNLDHRESEIENTHQSFLSKKNNYYKFKKIHSLSLLPKNADPEQTKLQLWIFIGLFILEFLLNLGVLQAGGATAMADAIAISITQTAINIGSCYLLGRVLLGRLIHSNLSYKLIFGLLGFIHIYFIALVNANMGIFRDTIVKNSQSLEVLFEVDMILGHWEWYPLDKIGSLDQISVLVIAMGLLFALIAYIDGFNSDDPYPGYGAIYREPLKLQRLLQSKITNLNHLWIKHLTLFNTRQSNSSENGFKGIQEWSQEINIIEQIRDDYKMMLTQLETSYDQIIKLYVSTYNKFHTKAPIKLKDLNLIADEGKDLDVVFGDVKEYFMKDNERLAEEKKKKKYFSDEFEKLKRELLKINNDISTEIKNLSKQYPTELN